jgi:hypothetical protein
VGPLEFYTTWQTKTNLDASNLAVFDAADQFQQFDHPVLEAEIAVTEFSARTVFAAAKFQSLKDPRRGVECGLASAHSQGFHTAKIHGLQQFY